MTQGKGTAPPTLAQFQAVFLAECSYVCRVLRRLGVVERDVEDLCQEVFVTVYAKFQDYDPQLPIRPWLFAFAFRTASNYVRSARSRREFVGVDSGEMDVSDSPEEQLGKSQQQALVLSALQRVPLDRRSAFILHDIDGFSAPDIARVLEIPLNTVYSRVRVARIEFRRAVEELQASEVQS